jgi:Sugar phosphate permease
LSYVLAYIDRINVSFAGLTMRGDLGMSAGTFGFAVGMFYWGYFIFEVPSNVILEKIGARIWIARIMITWGILAGLTAGDGFDELRDRALPARRRRGRILSRHHPLLHLLVSEPSSRPHRVRLPGRSAGRGRDRRADSTALLGLDGLFGLRGWQSCTSPKRSRPW